MTLNVYFYDEIQLLLELSCGRLEGGRLYMCEVLYTGKAQERTRAESMEVLARHRHHHINLAWPD